MPAGAEVAKEALAAVRDEQARGLPRIGDSFTLLALSGTIPLHAERADTRG